MALACAYAYARLLPARHALGEAGTCLAAQASLLSSGHGPFVDVLRRVLRPGRAEEMWWQCQAQDFLDVGSPDRLGEDEDGALRRAVQLRQIVWIIQHGGQRHLRPAPPHQADE